MSKQSNDALKYNAASTRAHITHGERVRSWANTAEETGDIRYLTANMIRRKYVGTSAAYLSQLPPADKDFLTLPD
jgi:hypothetical protein